MSTRSAIIIKVRENDLNKFMKFDPTKVPTKVNSWDWREIGISNNESSNEFSEKVKIEKPYIGIYCHSDGDFDGVGMVLKKVLNNYDAALNLIIGGDCSSVWYDGIKHYANRDGDKWERIKPRQGNTPFDVEGEIDHDGFVYCFTEDGWKVIGGNVFFDYNEDRMV